jgi:LPS export ABC transporter permease LptG/LPS export ABC transporter permease LptF
MGILSRAIFREVALAAALGTSLFTLVLFMYRLGSGKLFEVLLRGSASGATVAYLLALLLPFALVFALPTGTLVGVLIGLNRMSSDGEITAMRAAGVPGKRVVAPVLTCSILTMMAAALCSLYLQPFALREQYRIRNRGIAQQLTAEIQPRVFQEQFSRQNLILYVRDVPASASAIAAWKDVFIADSSPAEERSKEGREYGDAPSITIAGSALAVPDAAHNTIQLSMRDVSTHAVDRDPTFYYNTTAPTMDQLLAVNQKTEEMANRIQSMDSWPLFEEAKRTRSVDARVELHRRLALPVACLLLALVGIPLGAASRRGGRGGAFVVTVLLAFLYYMSLVSLIGLAQQGRLQPELAAWGPNAIFGLIGIALVIGIDRPGDRDYLSRLRSARDRVWTRLKARVRYSKTIARSIRSLPRIPLVPGVIDTYVLSTFLFYFILWLAAFVMLAHIFIFFDLLGDYMGHSIALSKVVSYHVFLTPKLIYDSAAMAVLAAVLVTFAVMSKNNEVTAMKACGVSLYRLSAPVILAAGLVSGVLFLFDHYYIPQSNRIQERLLAEIKGRPPQTFLDPNRKFVNGQDPRKPRIYNFKYYDPGQNVMVGVNVYELAETPFRLMRHVSAESARWEPSLKSWVFQNGWVRDFAGVESKDYKTFQATTFPEMIEPPSYFLVEEKQEKQLNFQELERYIRDLQQSGFNTVRLQVQYHKKFSVPMFALVIGLLAVPFSFMTGNRGAMAGVGVSLGIALAYFALGRLFEEVGNVNQLPATMAAWSPVAVFALAGTYMFGRMRT